MALVEWRKSTKNQLFAGAQILLTKMLLFAPSILAKGNHHQLVLKENIF